MSQVEEIIERIKGKPGIEGYVICSTTTTKPQVLRRHPSMTQEAAEKLSHTVRHLAAKAQNVVRDLDPPNELQYLRIKTKKHELIVAVDAEFLVIVLQRWTPYSPST